MHVHIDTESWVYKVPFRVSRGAGMAGTSLAMAPGMLVGQLAEFVDLDGPLLHAEDREHGIEYDRGLMQLPSAALWG